MTVTADPSEEGTAAAARFRSNAQSQGDQSAMSLTYSDFVYTRNEYTEEYTDENREHRRSLPSDFKPIKETNVPLMQVVDKENHDFILIAEFSEQEGPIPLCTIPNDASGKTNIKLSDFVVHLMSTDYLVNTVGQFRICQDTQVMRKNVFQNVHVFMQYFTLYDLKARGFVRPFCFGYVSKDHIKLDKYINFLMNEFGKVTSVLEHCNREWFAKELEIYLQKLENAKETYIKEHAAAAAGLVRNDGNLEKGSSNDVDPDDIDSQSDVFVDSDSITLAQIAHQYSEIKNILTTVQSFEHSNQTFNQNVILDIYSFFNRNPDSPLVHFLKKVHIPTSLPTPDDGLSTTCVSESLQNIPLLHPLRFKGEALRPLTVLGQLGTVHLVGRLMQIYGCCKTDIIFTEMTESTVAFRQHFENLNLQYTSSQNNNNNNDSSSPGRSSGISADFDNSIGDLGGSNTSAADTSFSEDSPNDSRLSSELLSPFELLLDGQGQNYSCSRLWNNYLKRELYQIIDKLHASSPVTPDNKSGSYHTVSEEEFDVNIPSHKEFSTGKDLDCDASVLESTIDNGSVSAERDRKLSKGQEEPSPISPSSSLNPNFVDPWASSGNISSFNSDEEFSSTLPKRTVDSGTSEEIILKQPWWIYASKNIVKGVPGYGLASFFRAYQATAHHILYSILLGRPIILCGEEKMSRRIGRIITALIPLVPLPPGGQNSKSWKLLRWHRGILVQSHIESYRLIGLCIPEKLEVHDLIPTRLVTHVTILSVERKKILGGPAYSGDLLQNFEKDMQQHFYKADVGLLSYIGGIYADIEAKVYTYKSLLDKWGVNMNKGKITGANIPLVYRELNLRASDVEIVKYLSNFITDPSDCVNIL